MNHISHDAAGCDELTWEELLHFFYSIFLFTIFIYLFDFREQEWRQEDHVRADIDCTGAFDALQYKYIHIFIDKCSRETQ